jgi:hypothetical protein
MKNENLKNHLLISLVVLFILYLVNSFVQGTFDPFETTTKSERQTQLLYIFFFETISNLYYYSKYTDKYNSSSESNQNN